MGPFKTQSTFSSQLKIKKIKIKLKFTGVTYVYIYRIEHQRLHEKHKGHEAMHAEMVLILISTLILAQILLVQWKQRHFRSYQVKILIG